MTTRSHEQHHLIRGSLSARISLSVLALTTLILGLFGAQQYRVASAGMAADLNAKADRVSARLASGIQRALWTVDTAAGEELVASEMNDPDVIGAYVLENGTVQYGFRRAPGAVADPSTVLPPVGDYLVRKEDVHKETETLGTVVVYVGLHRMEEDRQSILITTLIQIILLDACVAVVLIVLFHRMVLSPLGMLNGVIKAVRQGDLDREIDTSRSDELGTLAGSFAGMRDAVRDTISQLKERERDLMEYADAMTTFNSKIATDGTMLRCSKLALEAGGLAPEDVIGKPFWDTYWWSYDPAQQAWLRDAIRAAAGGSPVRCNVKVRMADEKLIDISFNLQPVFGEGEVKYLVAEGRDVSDLKRVEEELARHRDHLEQLLEERTSELAEANRTLVRLMTAVEQSMNGIAVLDLDEKIEFVNAAWACAHGLDVDGLHGQHVSVFHTEDQFLGNVVPLIATVRKKGTYEGEVEHVRNDGSTFPTRMSVATLRSEEDVPTGFIAVARDITEQKRAEQERERLNRELVDASRRAGMSEIATGILHNVGNVLNSVNVSANLVAERIRKSAVTSLTQAGELVSAHADDMGTFVTQHPQGRHLASFLIEAGKHVSAEQECMLESMADLQKSVGHIKGIVAMQQTYARVSGVSEVVALDDLIEDALRLRTASLERHGVDVVREYEDVPAVTVDRHKVMQILVNLIGNAKHALTDERRHGARLTIRIGPSREGHAQIQVIDNGVGIAPENMTRIFTHGFTTKKEGHGFGLHSAALAAKEMDGSLRATSDGAGCGACFTLELPLRQEARGEQEVTK